MQQKKKKCTFINLCTIKINCLLREKRNTIAEKNIFLKKKNNKKKITSTVKIIPITIGEISKKNIFLTKKNRINCKKNNNNNCDKIAEISREKKIFFL